MISYSVYLLAQLRCSQNDLLNYWSSAVLYSKEIICKFLQVGSKSLEALKSKLS